MKFRFILLNAAILLTFFSAVRAADIKDLFLKMPSQIVKDVDRNRVIAESSAENSLLKLKFPKDFSGEFKILSEKKDETVIGFSVYSCEESELEIWSVKKGVWKNITDSAAPKLGAKDVTEMLKVSPATVEKLDKDVSLSYFFTFAEAENQMRLVIRKQAVCDIAGTVYEYKFSGRKFVRN